MPGYESNRCWAKKRFVVLQLSFDVISFPYLLEQMIELLELMELYCELLIARFGLLDLQTDSGAPDPGVAEAVSGIIHAATRTELKELHVLREMLMSRYGRDYSIACIENEANIVPARVTSSLSLLLDMLILDWNQVTNKLIIETPPKQLVDNYLLQLAEFYHVDWKPEGYVEPSSPVRTNPPKYERAKSDALSTQDQQATNAAAAPEDLPETITVPPSEADHTVIMRTSLPSPNRVPKAPTVAQSASPAASSTQTGGAAAKPADGTTTAAAAPAPAPAASKKKQEDDAFDALARRFAELKKR